MYDKDGWPRNLRDTPGGHVVEGKGRAGDGEAATASPMINSGPDGTMNGSLVSRSREKTDGLKRYKKNGMKSVSGLLNHVCVVEISVN